MYTECDLLSSEDYYIWRTYNLHHPARARHLGRPQTNPLKTDPTQSLRLCRAYERFIYNYLKTTIVPSLLQLHLKNLTYRELFAYNELIQLIPKDRIDDFIENGWAQGIIFANQNGGLYAAPMSFELPTDSRALDLIKDSNYRLFDGFSQATSDDILRIINREFNNGLNPRDIARIVTREIDDVSRFRAYRIAHTEIMRSVSTSTLERYAQIGVKYVEWFAAEDERTCEICGGLHRRVYVIDAVPPQPAHPLCRCTWLATRDGTEAQTHDREYDPEDIEELTWSNPIQWAHTDHSEALEHIKRLKTEITGLEGVSIEHLNIVGGWVERMEHTIYKNGLPFDFRFIPLDAAAATATHEGTIYFFVNHTDKFTKYSLDGVLDLTKSVKAIPRNPIEMLGHELGHVLASNGTYSIDDFRKDYATLSSSEKARYKMLSDYSNRVYTDREPKDGGIERFAESFVSMLTGQRTELIPEKIQRKIRDSFKNTYGMELNEFSKWAV